MKKIEILAIMLSIFIIQGNLLAMNKKLIRIVKWGKRVNIEKIRTLIDKGANVNAVDRSGHSVLMNAISSKNPKPEIINLLIDKGADVNFVNNIGFSVLMQAMLSKNPRPKIINLIIDRGADVNFINTIGESVLTEAALSERPKSKIIDLLIDRGADVNAVDRYGNPVLMKIVSSKYSKPEIINLLINKGADVNFYNKYKESVLMKAVLLVSPRPEIINLLIDKGADVDAIDRYGNSVLMRTIFLINPNPEIIFLLINRGANIDLINNIGETATCYARKKGIIAPNETLTGWYRRNLYSTRNETGDFTIIVNNNEIKVHKAILTTGSTMFRNMLEETTDDSNRVPIEILSLPALNAVIEFIYTKQILNLTQEIADELLDEDAEGFFLLPQGELERYLEIFLQNN